MLRSRMNESQSEADLGLLQAAEEGSVPLASESVKLGAQIDCVTSREHLEGITPLMLASRGGRIDVVRFLLESGAKVNRKTRSPVPGETRGETALHWAMLAGQRRVCRLLLSHQASVEASSSRGNALAYAIEGGDVTLVRQLLKAGCSVTEVSGREKNTPVEVAAKTGSAPILKLLLRAGAKPLPNDYSGTTPLMSAAVRCQAACVKLLLEAGDRVNTADRNGWTPLMWAALGNAGECVRLLLKSGSDPDKHANDGRTALDIAKDAESHEAVFYLQRNVARLRAR